MTDPILSIEDVAEQTPWSKTTLYRVAPKEDSPFRKVGGRWVTTESDLLEWVRRGPKPRQASIGNPMPLATTKSRSSFAAKLAELERSTGGIDS